jgi:hypothetical protein
MKERFFLDGVRLESSYVPAGHLQDPAFVVTYLADTYPAVSQEATMSTGIAHERLVRVLLTKRRSCLSGEP